MGRLAGGIAHDFNNVLTAIKGTVGLLLMDVPKEEPMREDLEEIDRAANRAASLTRQLLAFGRKQILQPEVLDLNQLVSRMAQMLSRTIGEQIQVVTRLEPALDRVRADPGQMEQVVLNLALNAWDSMPTGGILMLETRNAGPDEPSAGACGGAPSGWVQLVVSDTGAGMDEVTRSRVFEPFFSTREQGKGTGLGLATVYGIVKQSGGYLWVYSEEGRGTTFKIYLPRVEAVPAPAAEDSDPAPVRERTGTVLLVEDEPTVRRNGRRILERAGFHVLEAGSGEEALRVAEAHERRIDLLLTDVVMPGMNGRVLGERVRENWPGTRVLFTSGYTDEAISQHGVLEPGIAFLQKPYGPDALVRKVAKSWTGRMEAHDRGSKQPGNREAILC